MTSAAIVLGHWRLFARIAMFDPATGDLHVTARPQSDLHFQGVFDFLNGRAVGIYSAQGSLHIFVDDRTRSLHESTAVHVRSAPDPLYDGESELTLRSRDEDVVLLKYRPMPGANLPWWEDAFDESEQDFGRYLEAITSDPDRRNRLMQTWIFATTND